MSSEATKNNVSIVNSILLTFMTVVISYLTLATIDNGKKLAGLTAAQVTREELNVKYIELRQRQDSLAAELVMLRIDVVKLQTKP